MLDSKGIVVFLAITLTLTLIVLAIGETLGWFGPNAGESLRLAGVLLLLWIPALAAWVTQRITGAPVPMQSIQWPLPPVRTLVAAAMAPVMFAVIFAVLWLLGRATPQWNVTELFAVVPGDGAAGVPSSLMLTLAFGVMLVAGPTVCALALIGHEYGWRGFLLPRLLPLGRIKAYGLAGITWAVWLTLVCARMYDLTTTHGEALRFLLLAFAFAFILNEIWRQSRNHGLTAVALGTFAANLEGAWSYLFPNKYLPWGGTTGIVAIGAWAALALAILARTEAPGSKANG